MADPPRDASIIPLSRYRARLSRARTGHRADEIYAHPDPAQLVPTLPLQDLYYAIRESGLESTQHLLELATPTQVRGFLDLDAWERDHFVPDRAAPWIDALVDLGPDALLRGLSALDGEVMALWVQRQAQVYDLEQEAPPEEPEGQFVPTPDTFFLLDIHAPGEAGRRVERFIDWLYRADGDAARRVLMAARWELPSDLEEHAYRWRSGRMADLGYVDYYEALEVYRYLDPASVRPDEHTADPPVEGGALPVELLAQVDEGSFLGRTLAHVADASKLDQLWGALLQLMNRVMSADRIDPADVEGAQAAMRRAAAWLGLGLEFLGRGDPERAAAVLGEVALARIFRVGFSLTLKLKRAADALVEHALVSLAPGGATLLDPPLSDLVAAVRQSRPLYPLALDRDVGQGGAGRGERPFASLAEVGKAAALLEEAAQIGDAFRRGLGIDPRLLAPEARARLATPPEAITFASIAGTVAANVVLDRPPLLVPLAPGDLAPLAARALEDGALRPTARLTIERAFAARFQEREFEPPSAWPRWLAVWLAHLEDALRMGAAHPAAAPLLITKE